MAKKTVLITGVSGGIGMATAHTFREAGWTVIGTDAREASNKTSLDHFQLCDQADGTAIEALYAMIARTSGSLTAVIHNAALQLCKPLEQTSLEEWDRVQAVNTRAIFWSTRLALPLLRKSGAGAIVNVSSVHAVATSKEIAAYATSKGALAALTRASALELASEGIRVNAVLPGAVDTGMLRSGLERGHVKGGSVEDRLADLGRKHPMGRVGQPREIAQAIFFLADSERSSFITGQALTADGGATARLSTE